MTQKVISIILSHFQCYVKPRLKLEQIKSAFGTYCPKVAKTHYWKKLTCNSRKILFLSSQIKIYIFM